MKSSNNKITVTWFSLWPVYYHVPIYKELHSRKNIDLTVFFYDDLGIREYTEKEFGNATRKWSNPELLEGYYHHFLSNAINHNNDKGFFTNLNLGIPQVLYKTSSPIVIVHGYSYLSDWLVFFFSKLFGKKIILRGEANLSSLEHSKKLKAKVKRFILSTLIKNCSAVLYSCTGNKLYWEFYGATQNKLFPIPCAVDNKKFQADYKILSAERSAIRKSYSIGDEQYVVLFSARFTKRKRPIDLINAIHKIDHSNITLLFVGDGPERQAMEKATNKFGISAVFTGFQEQKDISKFYAISDLDIVISEYDPSPKAMNEAMNFALPVIVTDIVGTAFDLVTDNKNGFIIQVGDTDTLAQKIDYLNNHRELSRSMGENSVEIVNNWTFEKDAIGIEAAINYVMEKH